MLRDRLQEIATGHGCAGFGVTAADPFDGLAAVMESRRETGLASTLAFTYRDPAVASDVRRSLPWAERLVTVGYAYQPDAGTAEVGGAMLRIARFADGDAYVGLRAALDALGTYLVEQGHRVEVLADDSRLVDRAAAIRSGIGWWGKSSMVLVPGVGPWVLIGSVVTDAPLDLDAPSDRSCGSCVACIPACPTDAIVADGIVDVRRCLAHLLQTPGVIPIELRPAVGDRLYGCDDCLTACPPGRRILTDAPLVIGPTIEEILGASDRELLDDYGHFYLPSRRPRILRRNALIAAGNDGSDHLEPIVIGHLGHPDWLLRAHASWAIGEFDTGMGRAAVDLALQDESDGRVRSELLEVKTRRLPDPGLR
ncbi:MAG: 4Fe-4S double cluster binding domain-containing protein [Actinomycetota bacterium]|nr:4Fe-4S double cluster binding domain-containing protein [Actinomycetota bacterium]